MHMFPKPLIEIAGKPMIEIVVQNLRPQEPHQFIFICREEHARKFALDNVLQLIAPGCITIPMQKPTAGALCTVLLAMGHLQDDDELLVANADQYVEASVDEFIGKARAENVDASIVTFPSTHPKWSYARVDEDSRVVGVAEKRPISRNATAGLYYFRRSGDFIRGAERMILKNATVNGEFYLCPVFNELVLAGKVISIYPIAREQMFSLGTPDDVDVFSRSKALELTPHK